MTIYKLKAKKRAMPKPYEVNYWVGGGSICLSHYYTTLAAADEFVAKHSHNWHSWEIGEFVPPNPDADPRGRAIHGYYAMIKEGDGGRA